jgi:hypothetical protein
MGVIEQVDPRSCRAPLLCGADVWKDRVGRRESRRERPRRFEHTCHIRLPEQSDRAVLRGRASAVLAGCDHGDGEALVPAEAVA